MTLKTGVTPAENIAFVATRNKLHLKYIKQIIIIFHKMTVFSSNKWIIDSLKNNKDNITDPNIWTEVYVLLNKIIYSRLDNFSHPETTKNIDDPSHETTKLNNVWLCVKSTCISRECCPEYAWSASPVPMGGRSVFLLRGIGGEAKRSLAVVLKHTQAHAIARESSLFRKQSSTGDEMNGALTILCL